MVSVVGSARALLNKLMEYDTQYAPRNVTLVKHYTGCDRRGTLHGPLCLRHFTLHYVPEFSHKQQIHLLCDILQDIPLPFQLLRCNNKTTIEEIELFFQRIASFPEHKYVIFDTNTLCSDIQEVTDILSYYISMYTYNVLALSAGAGEKMCALNRNCEHSGRFSFSSDVAFY